MPEAIAELRLRCPRCHAALRTLGTNEIHCAACGTAYPVVGGIPSFTPSVPGDQRVQRFFDNVACELSDTKLSYALHEAPELDRQFTILANAFSRVIERWVPRHSLLLDVGCGHGALLERVLSQYRFVGVDVALNMLPYAQKRGYSVYHGDAVALPFEDGQFDSVICGEVFQHFPDPTAILAELARVCRAGGTVIVSTLNRRSIARFVRRTIASRLIARQPLPIILRSAAEVSNFAARASLTLEEVAWVLSPTSFVAYSPGATSPADPLATNFILRLRA